MKKLVVAISSRALFDFEAENTVFETHNDEAYMRLQLQQLELPAKPGVALSLVKKLLAFNVDANGQPLAEPLVDVVILSRNDPVSGMRVFRSAEHYGLAIQRGVFTRGQAPWRYLKPLHANLFLSVNLEDVRAALEVDVPAAQVYPLSKRAGQAHPHEVRIAFDGDAVLFSDEAEQVFQAKGLGTFQAYEQQRACVPLPAGPFKPLLEALHQLQTLGHRQAATAVSVEGAAQSDSEKMPLMRLRTALVTARSAPAHERAIRTLMSWNIEVDEAMFLGGLAKGEFLREFEPDFFFDDQTRHVSAAAQHVPSGHVASGITNEKHQH